MNNLTLGSLFDGSGGFPLGGLISGIQAVWASEIEPFPIRVTTKRMPFMKHYGDMDDPQAPPIGTKGTVLGVDDIGSIMIAWDSGGSLNVVYGEDICQKIGS